MKGKKPIVKALIRITLKCNIACRHCYVTADASQQDHIDLKELKKIIDKLSSVGIETISFTGGQPTLRGEELIQAIHYASKKRKEVGYPKSIMITSNASVGESKEVAEYWVKNFLRAGLDQVNLSCDNWHREFLPQEYEEHFIAVAKKYGLRVKLYIVEAKRVENYCDDDKKILALRPGGRGSSRNFFGTWSKIPQCRLYYSRHQPEKLQIFVHPSKDIYICNVGVDPEMSMGKIFKDDLEKMIVGKMSGMIGALCNGDVMGLAKYFGADPNRVKEQIEQEGRCSVCCQLREKYLYSK